MGVDWEASWEDVGGVEEGQGGDNEEEDDQMERPHPAVTALFYLVPEENLTDKLARLLTALNQFCVRT